MEEVVYVLLVEILEGLMLSNEFFSFQPHVVADAGVYPHEADGTQFHHVTQ